MTTTEKLVLGSIDMHVHHGPDAHMIRRVDALQAAVQAEEGPASVVRNRPTLCPVPRQVKRDRVGFTARAAPRRPPEAAGT